MAKKYTQTEREEALKLAKEIGVRSAAERLGINEDTMYTWQSNAKRRAAEVTSAMAEKGPEGILQENEQLRKELKEKSEEIEILQDALGFFVKRRKK